MLTYTDDESQMLNSMTNKSRMALLSTGGKYIDEWKKKKVNGGEKIDLPCPTQESTQLPFTIKTNNLQTNCTFYSPVKVVCIPQVRVDFHKAAILYVTLPL